MADSRDISFATFNLYNLHLPGQRIYSDADGWTQEEYDLKVAWIARRLRELDADVIGFQEVWRVDALKACFEAAGLLDDYDIVGRDLSPAGIQVALAARKGLIVPNTAGELGVWTDDFPQTARFTNLKEATDAKEEVSVTIERFSRPPLKVVIQPKGQNPQPPAITVFVLHLKSKGPSRLRFDQPKPPALEHHAQIAKSVVSHVRRLVEAGAMRALLDGVMKGNTDPVVVLGDLNDDSLSVSTELLTGSPGYRFYEKSKAGSRSDKGLYTVEKLQQLRSFRHVYYTHIFEQKMESLDHILVSDAFYDHADIRQWSFREMVIDNDHLKLPDKNARKKIGATDHAIVRAQFDWNPMEDVPDA